VNFVATADGRLDLGGRLVPCALGWGGVKPAADKREGDGASPAGVWLIRRVLFRPDREALPQTALPVTEIKPEDGWCDAPDDPAYNRPVRVPYLASAERMWRSDGLYDVVVVLGHNDEPPVPGLGSAIFLHLAKPRYQPTEGCVAISRGDMADLLRAARPGDTLEIRAGSASESPAIRI
jgi:L,D-peptidoglycan transpeptidase YkuD (ErfK/YbiS/YcfS/YnhG family)